jgi:hypothetical protein
VHIRKILLWLFLAVVLVSFVLYRTRRSTPHMNVTPEAEREIEKAKRR